MFQIMVQKKAHAMSFIEAMAGFGNLFLNMVCSHQIDAGYEFYKTLDIQISDPF